MYGPNAEAALNHSAELETSENTFKTTLSEERQKAIDALESILKIVASAENPIEKAHSQEILNQMQTLDTISEKLDKALDTIEKARHKSDEQLKKIGITMLNATTPTSQESSAREILKPRNN
jgi:hypothetical protein